MNRPKINSSSWVICGGVSGKRQQMCIDKTKTPC